MNQSNLIILVITLAAVVIAAVMIYDVWDKVDVLGRQVIQLRGQVAQLAEVIQTGNYTGGVP